MSSRRHADVHIILVVGALAPLALCHTTSAQPLIHVRGQSDLRLQLVSSTRAPLIQGSLFSEAGEPLDSRSVRAALGTTDAAPELTLLTDADGAFELELDPALNHADVIVRFLGDADYTGCNASLRVDRDAFAASESTGGVANLVRDDDHSAPPAPPARLGGSSASNMLERAAPLALLIALAFAVIEWRAAARARAASVRAGASHRPGIVAGNATAWTPHHETIALHAIDHETGAALAGARGTIESVRGERRELLIKGPGEFESSPLEAGTWTVRVEHAGYAGVDARVAIPHRGEWLGAEVRLLSLRSGSIQVVRQALLYTLPAAFDRPGLTLRAALALVPTDTPVRAPLASLIASVEAIAYGILPPTPSQIEMLEQRSEALVAAERNPPSLRRDGNRLPESGPPRPGRR